MGTHPIFESDFDCLTEGSELNSVELRRFKKNLVNGRSSLDIEFGIMSKVYVGKLGAEPLDESDLEDEFEEFGDIKSIFVARNPPGFAYIEFYRDHDAKDAVYELQGKKVCGRKGVKVELARDSQRKRKRSRSISPETYRKYGSRTPSPRRKSRRSRSRSPIARKSKPLKPNKPKVKNQKSEESVSSSSSSSGEEVTPPSSPKVEKKKKSKNAKYKNYVITRQFKAEN